MLEPKVDENGSMVVRLVTDDDGNLLTDIICPIACGRCCDLWRGVLALKEYAKVRPDKKCPNLKGYGCRVKRHKRPFECKAYICELSALAIEGLVLESEIKEALEDKQQYDAFAFFDKTLQSPDCEMSVDKLLDAKKKIDGYKRRFT